MSPDGQWLAYRLVRVNEESELRVKSLAPEAVGAATSDVDAERVFVWGTGPVFSADSRWLVWTAGVSVEESERLAEEDEPVRLGAGLLDLVGGEERSFDEVGDFGFDESGRFLALHGYAPEKPEGPEGKGADLRTVDLETGAETTFGNVAEYAWSETGSLLALAVATGSDQGNGVQLYDAQSGRLQGLDSSGSTYRQLSWREVDAAEREGSATGAGDSADLALLRTVEPASKDGAAHHVLVWRGLDSGGSRPLVLDPAVAGVAADLEVVRHEQPQWSDDGRRVAIGLRHTEHEEEGDEAEDAESEVEEDGNAPRPDPDAGGEDEQGNPDGAEEEDEEVELPDLQIWHTTDVRLFPEQRAAEERDAQRTLLAVWHLDEDRVVQIGSDLMERAELIKGGRHAIEQLPAALRRRGLLVLRRRLGRADQHHGGPLR